ncbi:nitrile hydratase [Tistlia consotensis]|uniref:Nitrile hydratase n=1 Tax=Tistlia consotensis USBA 355 TaxID=560819 RepID=A0A1Y6CR66_9PROT|nr:nitrile hydratase [Tistlia consotensis USBA 355]SNS09902.1 nitrile hydratase [Tistlia consotensis]
MSAPRFALGATVRIAERTPPVHHRVPSYAKGQVGRIVRVCHEHGLPEAYIRGDGRPFQRLYRVRLDQKALWRDYAGAAGDTLDIEIFEPWLEPAE